MAPDEFQRKLDSIQQERDKMVQDALDVAPPPIDSVDNQAIVRMAIQDNERFKEMQRKMDGDDTQLADLSISRLGALQAMPPPTQRFTQEQYLGINGFDRDYAAFPTRFQFTISVSGGVMGFRNPYKNVQWMEANYVAVPMEITRASSGNNLTSSVVQKNYTYDFSISYPYVILALEGYEGAYDGTNEVLRRAFSVLVYDRSYQAPNGRGYVILKPAQNERRTFITPMSVMRSLSVSLLKPNGTLINNSMDNYDVINVQYEPQNSKFLKLICRQYFDGNELYVGDQIMIRHFTLEAGTNMQSASISPYRSLESFLNRQEGHDVVQLGLPNTQGFYNSFYILAPGVLDQTAGSVILDNNILSGVATLSAVDPADRATITSPGRLLNMSLQCFMAFRVGTIGAAIPHPDAPTNAAAILQNMESQLTSSGVGAMDTASFANAV
jgi:hypothetical protein